MVEKCCIHCKVTGRVQGVFFRAGTRKQAKQRGITGWVRNLSDGGVEVLACGAKDTVEQLYQWLQQGPRAAKVEKVFREELPWQEHTDFKIV